MAHFLQKEKKEVNIDRIRFVPCAIPNLNLSEVDIRSGIKIGHTQLSIAPLAIEVENENEAKTLHKIAGYELFYSNANESMLYIKKGVVIDTEACNKPASVKNGLELAKYIRVGKEPCIILKEMREQFETIEEQLRIAMFLVNAKRIEDLKKASIYVI